MTTTIHPMAVIHPDAVLGDGCTVGPFCVIGAGVRLGANVTLHSHVALDGATSIGDNTKIYPFASVGHPPQDLKYRGEPSRVEVGKNCTIREHVTINPGTEGGGMLTKVGDNCLLMVGVHIAHDCRVGSGVIMANNATIAGHVHVGDHAVLGGLCAVHQFVRIGKNAMIGGMSAVEKDVIPFGTVMGERAHLAGLNLVGLKRHGYSREEMNALRHAYTVLFEKGHTLADGRAALNQEHPSASTVQEVLAFLAADSARAFCTPQERGTA